MTLAAFLLGYAVELSVIAELALKKKLRRQKANKPTAASCVHRIIIVRIMNLTNCPYGTRMLRNSCLCGDLLCLMRSKFGRRAVPKF
jgi:hypothetical protein